MMNHQKRQWSAAAAIKLRHLTCFHHCRRNQPNGKCYSILKQEPFANPAIILLS